MTLPQMESPKKVASKLEIKVLVNPNVAVKELISELEGVLSLVQDQELRVRHFQVLEDRQATILSLHLGP